MAQAVCGQVESANPLPQRAPQRAGERLKGKYQFLEPLRPEEYASLKKDISERGCFVPIEVDERGNILDGHNRKQICEELGVEYTQIVRSFDSENEKVEHAIKVNLLRRHLGPISWANAFRKLCEVRGVQLGQGKRNDLSTSANLPMLASEINVPIRTARKRMELARCLAAHPDLAASVDSGKMEAKRALRVARTRSFSNKWKSDHQAKRSTLPQECRIEHCDFRNLKVEEHSVDLIHTDPPYSKEYKNIWRDIGAFAKHALKPGKLFITYTGQVIFNEALRQLEENLKYLWVGCLIYTEGYPSYHPYKIQSRTTPLLFFSNGDYEPRDWMNDGVMGEEAEKTHHPWQKNLKESLYYIERLTRPGEMVCDPFLGSGTTGVAAVQLGRSFVGCDVDERAVEITKRRLQESGNKKPREQ